MRADRLLSIMLLLQVHGRMTAGEIAKRLEVSNRTIYRDMEVLSGAGVPVVAERGTGGGWFLLDTYQTKLTGLNPDEIQALFLPMPDRLLSDLGLRRASEAALIKLLAALPTIYRRDAEFVRQRIYIDGSSWQRSDEDITFLPVLQAAVWQERRLQIVYHLSTGPIVEPILDPLGLVAKGNVWYLVALWKGNVSVYRVSRMQDARILDEPCTRPEGFDLATFWRASAETFIANLPGCPATMRVSPTVREHLRTAGQCPRVDEIGLQNADGWSRVRVEFGTEEEACRYAIGWGKEVEVLEPASLRVRILRHARQVVALYERHGCWKVP